MMTTSKNAFSMVPRQRYPVVSGTFGSLQRKTGETNVDVLAETAAALPDVFELSPPAIAPHLQTKVRLLEELTLNLIFVRRLGRDIRTKPFGELVDQITQIDNLLGIIHSLQNRHNLAGGYYQRALDVSRQHPDYADGHRYDNGMVLLNLANQAGEHAREATNPVEKQKWIKHAQTLYMAAAGKATPRVSGRVAVENGRILMKIAEEKEGVKKAKSALLDTAYSFHEGVITNPKSGFKYLYPNRYFEEEVHSADAEDTAIIERLGIQKIFRYDRVNEQGLTLEALVSKADALMDRLFQQPHIQPYVRAFQAFSVRAQN